MDNYGRYIYKDVISTVYTKGGHEKDEGRIS